MISCLIIFKIKFKSTHKHLQVVTKRQCKNRRQAIYHCLVDYRVPGLASIHTISISLLLFIPHLTQPRHCEPNDSYFTSMVYQFQSGYNNCHFLKMFFSQQNLNFNICIRRFFAGNLFQCCVTLTHWGDCPLCIRVHRPGLPEIGMWRVIQLPKFGSGSNLAQFF